MITKAKKISIITGVIVTGLCLLLCIFLVSALFYIESPQGSQRLQKTVNDHIPGTLTWQTLKFSPTRGVFEITNAVLASQQNKAIATFKRLFISLDPAALFNRELLIKKISITAPTIAIEKNNNNELNILAALVGPSSTRPIPAKPASPRMALPLNIIAHSIAVTDGTFSFVSVPDAMNATIKGVSMETRGNLEKMAAHLTLSTGPVQIKMPGVQTSIHSLHLSTSFLKNALTDLNLHLDADTASLDMTGSVHTLFSTPKTDIKVNLKGDIARTLAAVEKDTNISGQIAARATVKGFLTDPDITLFLDYPGGNVLNQKINRATVDITMTHKVCRIHKFFMDHDSGIINATGRVDLSKVFPRGFLNPEKHLDALDWNLTLGGKDIVPGPLLDSFGIKGISGTCQLGLTFSGGITAPPKGSLSFKAIGARYQDYPRINADIRLTLDQGIVDIKQCKVTSGATKITLLGDAAVLEPGTLVPLKNPRGNLNLKSNPIILETLTPYIPALGKQHLKGKVTLAANVNGSRNLPKAAVTLLGQEIKVAGESIKKVDLSARLDLKRLYLDTLHIALDDTRQLTATGWADRQHRFKIDLKANDIRLSSFNHIKSQTPADGLFSCNLSGRGTFEKPEVQGDISLTDLTMDGKKLQDFTATVSLQNQYAAIKGKFNFDINAGFNLATRDFKADLIFKKTALTPWLKLAGQKEITGNITGDIALNGNADHLDGITAKSHLEDLFVGVQKKFTFHSTGMNAVLQGKSFQVAPFTTFLPGQGRITLEASGKMDGDITAKATARIPAKAARLFTDTLPDLNGAVTLDATALIKKDIKASKFNAALHLNNLGMTLPDSLSKLHGINGTILADMNHVNIKEIKGFLDQGTFSITGNTSLKDFIPQAYTAKVTGKALPVTVPDGLNALFDVDLNLDGTLKKSFLTGTILLDSGELTQKISINKEILSAIINPQRSRKGIKTEETPNPYLENLTLDIFIQARNNFIVDLDLAYLEIHPDIRIQGSPLAPMVSGRSIIDPGTIQQYHKEFTLTRGIIDFTNPYKIEPEIDIQALHKVRDWDITLSVTGTPEKPVFSMTSDPELEQADITSLLLRGKTTNELISSEGGSTFSPKNALAQFAAASVQDDIRAATGLDIFEMGFDDPDNSAGVGRVNLTIGKKLTDRITVKYATASKDGQMVQTTSADYQMSDTISASGFQDSQGNFGGELKYRREFE